MHDPLVTLKLETGELPFTRFRFGWLRTSSFALAGGGLLLDKRPGRAPEVGVKRN